MEQGHKGNGWKVKGLCLTSGRKGEEERRIWKADRKGGSNVRGMKGREGVSVMIERMKGR